MTSRLNPAVTAQKELFLRNIETVALDPVDVDLDAAEGDGIALPVGDGVADEIAWNGRALTIGNGSVTVEAGKITLPKSFMEANLGENDLVVLTSSARYTVKVTVATLIIDDDSDFKRIKSEFYKGDYTSTAANYRDGYFVLANNIDMKGAAFTMLDGVQLKKPITGENTDVNNQACIDTYGWSGVLDGRGVRRSQLYDGRCRNVRIPGDGRADTEYCLCVQCDYGQPRRRVGQLHERPYRQLLCRSDRHAEFQRHRLVRQIPAHDRPYI